MSSNAKTWIKIAIPVAIGIAVAILLFHNDFNADALRDVDFDSRAWWGLGLALLCVVGRETGMAWRYRTLSGKRLSWRSSIRVTMLCEFTSCITPTSVGGSAASAIFMTRNGLTAGRSTAIMLTTLFLDELFITLIVPLTFILIPYKKLFGFGNEPLAHDLQLGFWLVYGILAAWSIVLWIGLFVAPSSIKNLLVKFFSLPIIKRWKPSVEEAGDDIITTARELRSCSFRIWLKSFGATALSWLSRFLTVNALLWGFAAGADQILALGRQIAVWVLLMFTPTPGGSGMSEWIFTKYYGDIITSAATIMIIALLWRILTYYLYLIIGITLIPSLSKKHKKI